MIIAISITNNKVDDFASARNFALFNIDYPNCVIQKKIIIDAENCPGFASKVFQLIDIEVKVLLTKQISDEEKIVLNNSKIEVADGFNNDYNEAINQYLMS